MPEMDLGKILETQKAHLESFTKTFGAQLEETLLIQVDGKLAPISDEVKTVGDYVKKLQEQVASYEAEQKKRTTGVMPGLEDEIEANGGVDLSKALPGLPTFDKNSRDWSLVRENTEKQRGLAGYARAQSHDDDAKGGVLVATQMLPGFIELARAQTVVWDPALISVFDNLVGAPVEIPTETSAASVSWVGEVEAPTATDVSFGEVRFQPKKLASLVKFSNRLLRMSPNLAMNIVQNNIAKGIGLEIDRVLLRGSGVSGEPRGIINTPGIIDVEIAATGGDFTYAIANNMVIELEGNNTAVGNLEFISHPRAFGQMRAERIAQFSADTTGAYVILPMTDDQMRAMLGYGFRKTTVLPTNLTKSSGTALTEVYFANWEDLYFALWSQIEFKSSDVTGDSTGSALSKDQTWLYAFTECDVQLARAKSFALVNDAKTT